MIMFRQKKIKKPPSRGNVSVLQKRKCKMKTQDLCFGTKVFDYKTRQVAILIKT